MISRSLRPLLLAFLAIAGTALAEDEPIKVGQYGAFTGKEAAFGVSARKGVIMAFDRQVDLHDIVRRVAGFFRDESCGQCVPCRVGTVRQEEALHRLARATTIGGVANELALLEEVGVAMRDASICGLGQTAYAVVESAIKRLRLYEVTS